MKSLLKAEALIPNPHDLEGIPHVSEQKRTRTNYEDMAPESAGPAAVPRLIHRPKGEPPRRRRWLRWLVGVCVVACGLVAFSPTLISQTSIGDWLLQQGWPTAWGKLKVQERSLQWWDPIRLGGIELADSQGRPLLQIGSVTTKESLWDLLINQKLSEVQIEQGAVHCEWRADGSNWEDWLSQILPRDLGPDESTTADMPDLRIDFNDCQVLLDSQTDQQRWLAKQLSGSVQLLQNSAHIELQATGDVEDIDQDLPAGRIQASVVITDQAGLRAFVEQQKLRAGVTDDFEIHTTTGGIGFDVELEGLATSVGRSILRRYWPTLELSGLASGQVAGLSNWYGDYIQVALPKVALQRVLVSDQVWLSGDQLRLEWVDVSGSMSMSPRQMRWQRFDLRSDIGRGELDGVVQFDELMSALATRRLPTTTLQSQGSWDVARLANQLPNTLQLQSDVRLDQGDVTWQLFNRPEGDGSQRLFLDLVAQNIAGQRNGGRVQWAQPIQASLSLRDYDRPVTFDHLDFNSEFLQATARPKPTGGTEVQFTLQFDRLKQAMEQFFQLPPVTLRGQARGVADWQLLGINGQAATLQEPAVGLTLRSNVTMTEAHVVIPNYIEVLEPNMQFVAETQVSWGQPRIEAWDWANLLSTDSNLTVKSGRVELSTLRPQVGAAPVPGAVGLPPSPSTLGLLVQLKQPVYLPDVHRVIQYMAGSATPPAQAAAAPVLEADVVIGGPLEQWLAMAHPLLMDTDLALTGNLQSQFRVALNERFALVNNLQARSQQFGFRGWGVLLQEPDVQVAGAASYHYANGLIHTEDLMVASSSLAARATKTRLQFSPVKNRLEGDIYVRGDLARLWHTYQAMQLAQEVDPPKTLGWRRWDFKSMPTAPQAPAFDEIALVSHLEPAAAEALPVNAANPASAETQPMRLAENRPAAVSNGAAAPMTIGGELIGLIQLSTEEVGGIKLGWNTEVKNGWIGSQMPNGQWAAWVKEPSMKFVGTATAPLDLSRIDMPTVQVESQQLRGTAAARVLDLAGDPMLDVRGTIDSAVLDWLRQFAGAELQDLDINGLRQHQFELNGPLSLTSMQGRWISSWQGIRWMGLQSGPADVVLQLQQGILKMVPMRFAAGGGQVNLAPEVDLRTDPMWVRMPRGVIFDQVELTPEICRNWLKYSAPLLAEVTSVQGSFSLDSDGIEVPLSDWTKLVAKARVTINGARVGPGPLGIQIGNIAQAIRSAADGQSLDASALQSLGLGGLAELVPSGNGQRTAALQDLASQWLAVATPAETPNAGNATLADASSAETAGGQNGSPRVWLDLPPQTLGIQVQDGAVVHDNLKLSVRGFELVTGGRVGLDQSVAVQTQLMIPEDVQAKNPQWFAALGPSLKLPIGGTLSRPTIEAGHLRTALNSAMTQGLQNSLGDSLQKRLGLENPNGGNSLPNLLEQGQRRLEEKLNEKLPIPPVENIENSLNRLFQRGAERGRIPQPGGGK